MFRDTLYHFCESHVCGTCSVYVSVVESCSYKYLHMLSLLKINAVDSERPFLFLLSLCLEMTLGIDLVSLKQMMQNLVVKAEVHPFLQVALFSLFLCL